MQELLYTSVPRGLKPGSRGFSTVLSTQGMVAPLAAALEALSGYRPVFPIGHARVAENPVVYSHLKLQVAGKSWYVLSRVADYGLDYSQRTNKLAHHLVLDKSELPAAGPASLLRASGIMRESWEGEPKIVPAKSMSKHPIAPSGMCQAWKEMTGDAGWAGVLAESFLKDPNRPVILLFEPGQDLRPLIDESLSLLPAERRWDVTFSTYFTGSSQGITCLWRGIVLGSKEATESLRFVNALRIDLTTSEIGRAEGGELVDAARKGIRLTARPTLSPKQTASREQPKPRAVVKDNADESTVPKSTDEASNTETHATPVVNYDHSQAPPRLTPSVFKFANAVKQTAADYRVVHKSRGLRVILPLVIGLLLVGIILLLAFKKDEFPALMTGNAPNDKGSALVTQNLAESPGLPESNRDCAGGHSKPAENSDGGADSGASQPEKSTGGGKQGENDSAESKVSPARSDKSEDQHASGHAAQRVALLDVPIPTKERSAQNESSPVLKTLTIADGSHASGENVTLRLVPPKKDFPIKGGQQIEGKLPVIFTATKATTTTDKDPKEIGHLKLKSSSGLVFIRTTTRNEEAEGNLSLCLLEISFSRTTPPMLVALHSEESVPINHENDGKSHVESKLLTLAMVAQVHVSLHDVVIEFERNKGKGNEKAPFKDATPNDGTLEISTNSVPETSVPETIIEVTVSLGPRDPTKPQLHLDVSTKPTETEANDDLTKKVDEIKDQLNMLIMELKKKKKGDNDKWDQAATALGDIVHRLNNKELIPDNAVDSAVSDQEVQKVYHETAKKLPETIKACKNLLERKEFLLSLAKAKILQATVRYEVHHDNKSFPVDLIKLGSK